MSSRPQAEREPTGIRHMNRRGFLQALIGVPLAVKAYLSVPAIQVGSLSEMATAAIRQVGPYEWFDFTLESQTTIQRWASWSGESGYVVTDPGDSGHYSVTAKCYGAHPEFYDAIHTKAPVYIEVPNAGAFRIELEAVAINTPADDVQTTEICGWVIG